MSIMTREIRGIQIALIIFVMLTIILGVTTFLFFQRYQEALAKAKTDQETADKQRAEADRVKKQNERLKEMIGFAAADEIGKCEEEFNRDIQEYSNGMKTHGKELPADQKVYRKVIEQLLALVKEGNERVNKLQLAKAELEAKYAAREESTKPQISQFASAAARANRDLEDVKSNYREERTRLDKAQQEIAAALDRARRESQQAAETFTSKLQEAGERLEKLEKLNRQRSEQLASLQRDTVERPSGQIRWVDQRAGKVWINLGRADALNRQVSFAVYGANAPDLTSAGRKASIEVTQILGDHLAEARIVEDKLADPIMVGDIIYSPLWNPGQRQRFAIAGFIDLDGDGRGDLQMLRNIITMNGGVVDCWLDPNQDAPEGDITIHTRYLVLGTPPGEGGAAGNVVAYGKMVDKAKQLGLETIPVAELLRRMGWKSPTSTAHTGTGVGAGTTPPPAAGSATRPAPAGTESPFRPRTPPTPTRPIRSAY